MLSKGFKRVVGLGLVFTFVIGGSLGMIANAQRPEEKGIQERIKARQEVKEDMLRDWKSAKDALETEKSVIEGRREEREALKDALLDKAEKAKIAGDMELYESTMAQIKEMDASIGNHREQMANIRAQMKESIRGKYTQEELDELREAGKRIVVLNPDITIIPIENIFTRKNLKFDTPPVIKEGRTLIPIRALTEGFGATVEWNAEDRVVTVSKGDVVIVFQLSEGKVFVNGEETAIDVPAQIMNNRTVVPLRFILERFNLKVDHDPETGIIEIDDEDDDIYEDIDEDIDEEDEDDDEDEDVDADADDQDEDDEDTNDTQVEVIL